MKKNIYLTVIVILLCNTGFSQTNCGDAVAQLQNYASQINQFYNNEYWTIIPNQRCPAFDHIGRPYNPVLVQNCRLQTLAYLNNWYQQQCNYVNTCYATIVRGCALQPPSSINRPAPKPKPGSEESEQIDTDQIQDLTAGIDEDKTVRITIPKTAEGFKPRRN